MSEHRNGSQSSAAPRLLDRLREAVSVRRYSPRTAEAYVYWARKFILFHGKRHPSLMGQDKGREVCPLFLPLMGAVVEGGLCS